MGTILLITCALVIFWGNPGLAEVVEQSTPKFFTTLEKKNNKTDQPSQEQKPLDFSDTGRPGQQTAGESRGNCDRLDSPLEAVIPASHSGKTTLAHPSFWVYFPYAPAAAKKVEFILQNEAREDILRSQLPLNGNHGYQRFDLPDQAPALEVGQWYRWYVKVYCDDQTTSAQYVQGWVQRVPVSSRLYIALQDNLHQHLTYAQHGIWYEAVDSLLKVYQQQPSNLAWELDWRNLIQAKGVELETLPSVRETFKAVK